MPEPTMIVTITRGPDGKPALWVSLSDTNGAPAGPPRPVILNNRLAGFVANMQAFAREKLESVESAAQGRTEDRDPALAVESVDGEQIGPVS